MAHRYNWVPKLTKGAREILIASLTLMVEGDTGPMDALSGTADHYAAEMLEVLRNEANTFEPARRGAPVSRSDIASWRAKRLDGKSVAAIAREAKRPYTTVYDWIGRLGQRRDV